MIINDIKNIMSGLRYHVLTNYMATTTNETQFLVTSPPVLNNVKSILGITE